MDGSRRFLSRRATAAGLVVAVAALALGGGAGGYAFWSSLGDGEVRPLSIQHTTEPPPIVVQYPFPPLRAALDDTTRACADWRDGSVTLSADDAARAIAVCNALMPPGERVAVSVPGSNVAISLDERSVAVGAGLGVFGMLALRGLAAMFRGPDRRAPQRAPDPIPQFRYDEAQ